MIRLSRGDVILCRGQFALAWDTQSTPFIRIFPIGDPTEGCAPGDVIIPDSADFRRITGYSVSFIAVTQGRMVAPAGWLKVPDLALDRGSICLIGDLINRFAITAGAQCVWPISGTRVMEAPIFAS